MKTILIIICLITLTTHYSLLNSTLWEIKQDGTGDFTTITAGIDAAVAGDTILVYPGRYVENINYSGKNITVTSLYGVISEDRSIIGETIIDGNRAGSVVFFNSGENRDAVLNGFTITNGKGDFLGTSNIGGGIYIFSSSPTISFCRIKRNYATFGGAIYIGRYSNPLLKGNSITYNYTINYGAISIVGSLGTVFCPQSLNSVYLNFAGYGGNDLLLASTRQSSIIIDTLTVLNPDRTFVYYTNNFPLPEDFTLTINNGKIEPVAADLYVRPDGCDTNSGLTPADPLQTIAMAMTKIKPDSLEQRTVYVAEGIYSRSLNNQFFPIQVRSYVDIIGADKESTVLDLEEETYAVSAVHNPAGASPDGGFKPKRNYTFKNFTIINGGNQASFAGVGAIYLEHNFSVTFENIDIFNCRTGSNDIHNRARQAFPIYHSDDINIKNLHINDYIGQEPLRITTDRGKSTIYIENLRIRHSRPGPYFGNLSDGIGGGVMIASGERVTEPLTATLVNVEISDCMIGSINPIWGRTSFSHLILNGGSTGMGHIRVINATVGDNHSASQDGAGIKFSGPGKFELINSIVYGNSPSQIALFNNKPDLRGDLTVSHSLINGGLAGFTFIENPNIEVNWGDGNLDANPLWAGEAVNPDYPYMLSEYSRARGAGTLDIPGFEFPEFDLAGNPRIVDGKIDMGAYQWHPPTSVDDDVGTGYHTVRPDYNLRNFPNPVTSLSSVGASLAGARQERSSTGTNIAFELPEAGNVMIEIYNLKGQFVRRIFDAYIPKGEHNVFWDGRDERGRYVATGFYMYNLHINNQLAATGRATFIK